MSTMHGFRIGVLASGSGSNLQALIDRFNTSANSPARIVWVGSNKANAGALERARNAGIHSTVISADNDGTALLAQLRDAHIDLLVLAGYLRLIPAPVITAYRGKIINIHPSLLPAFGGAGMYGVRVHEAVLSSGVRVSGATVHMVDEHFDRGVILAQWPVLVHASDTANTLAARVLHVEHHLLPRVVEAIIADQIVVQDNGTITGEVPMPDIPLPIR